MLRSLWLHAAVAAHAALLIVALVAALVCIARSDAPRLASRPVLADPLK